MKPNTLSGTPVSKSKHKYIINFVCFVLSREKTIFRNIIKTNNLTHALRMPQSVSADHSKIIISHRVSTIKDADEILFIEDGAIVERGTHDELVSLGGRYNKLYEDQLLEQKINRGDE